MDININSHISLISNDDIKKIFCGFFKNKKIDINHLNYIHKFHDGTAFYLCSNHQWIKHYLISGYMNIGAFETNPSLSNDRYILWDSLENDDVILKDSKELINVNHGITIVNITDNGIGFFNFGTTNGSIVTLNSYLNNLNIINSFIPYFYAEADSIIKEASEQRIFISPNNKINNSLNISNPLQSELVRLSNREMECINWYLKGKNSGDIAVILQISRRTVETHIESVKIKLGCSTLFQIGYCIAAMKYTSYGFIPKL